MTAQTCKCGRGKMSAYDEKCGNCRTKRERVAHRRMLDGWTPEEARRGHRDKGSDYAARVFGTEKPPGG